MTRWLEMAAWLIAATIGSRALPPRAALRVTSLLAEILSHGGGESSDERLCEAAHAIAAGR